MHPLLEVRRLVVHFETDGALVRAVDGASLTIGRSMTVGVLGASGSGKTVAALSILRLVPDSAARLGGEIVWHGDGQAVDLGRLPQEGRAMRRIRGRGIGMVFQDPTASLNPVLTIGAQLRESLRTHAGCSWREAEKRSLGVLQRAELAGPKRIADEYAHRLSGGMAQRAAIAIAIACEPQLLIADEPTTALDVTTQAQILSLLATIKSRSSMSILHITHDVAVLRAEAEQVYVMSAGKIIEEGNAEAVLTRPRHRHTKRLVGADSTKEDAGQLGSHVWDRSDRSQRMADRGSLLQVRDLKKHFPVVRGIFRRGAGWVRAVDGIDLDIASGETLALVGESGCGKTTTGRVILRLAEPTSGSVILRHTDEDETVIERSDVTALTGSRLRSLRRDMQIIFQDPFSSLNPRMTVGHAIEEPLRAQRQGSRESRRKRAAALLERVGMLPGQMTRYPHEFSGGERQRIAIARALILGPRFIVCDEPVSSLDRPIRENVLDLLRSLQEERGHSYLFIAHDLDVVRSMADRIAVMYSGRIVESASGERLHADPRHPYTEALLCAARGGGHDACERLGGEPPSAAAPPSGCAFHPRCPHMQTICAQEIPALERLGASHVVACHRAVELAEQREARRNEP